MLGACTTSRLLLDVLAVRDDELAACAGAVRAALAAGLTGAVADRPRQSRRPARARPTRPLRAACRRRAVAHARHGRAHRPRQDRARHPLTGTNTDRLREERERGISIELGYAELELPGGRRLSVVDVPGHERFVRTMVAGATGIDLFLLVVAADDGVMPQTVEHLAIIELLGVQRGVVALTKADLVDDELLELAREDVASSSPHALRATRPS